MKTIGQPEDETPLSLSLCEIPRFRFAREGKGRRRNHSCAQLRAGEPRIFCRGTYITLASGPALVCLTKRLNELPETRKSGPKLTLTTALRRRSIAGDSPR